MPADGTELFRYPIPYQAVLEEISARWGQDPRVVEALDVISPMLEERDRNLEDAIEHILDGVPSVFVVVADDGSGDYDSIKDAIEASSNGVSGEAGTAIWVKPGTYDDGGAGAVNLNGTKRVWVFAAPPASRALTSAHQTWTFDGFSCTSGTAEVSLTGFSPRTGALEDWLTGAGTIYLHLDRCRGLSGRGFFGATGSHHLRLTDTDASALVLFTASTGAAVPSTVYADNSDVALTTAGSTPPILTSVSILRIDGGDITHAAGLTASCSAGTGGVLQFANCFLSGGGTITSAFDNVTLTGVVTDEDSTAVDFSFDGISGSRFAMIALAGNSMHGSDLTFGNNCRVSVHGAYRSLVIGSTAGAYFVELDTVTAAVAITLANTSGGGDDNFVVASVRTPGGGSSQVVSIPINCNENIILYTVNGTPAVADGNAGTNNLINALPGAPAAHGTTHNPGGTDPVTTAAAGTIQPDDSAAEGTAASLSRSDHRHAIAADTAVSIGGANSEGVSTSFSRADHVHALPDVLTAGGPTGSASVTPQITWDAKGRLTAVTAITQGYQALIGDGAATSFNVDHNLGTLYVLVAVYIDATGVEVMPDTITRSTTNRVVLTFDTAPASNELRVLVKAVA